LVQGLLFEDQLPDSDGFFAGLFALSEDFSILAVVLILPVVEAADEDLVALLDFHGHLPSEIDGLIVEVSVETEELGSVMVNEFKSVVNAEFFAGFDSVFVVVGSGDIELRMEGTLLFGIDFKSESVVISISLLGSDAGSSRSRLQSVDVLLVEFPSNLELKQVIDTEFIIDVLEDTVRASVGTDGRLVSSHGHRFDHIGLTSHRHGS